MGQRPMREGLRGARWHRHVVSIARTGATSPRKPEVGLEGSLTRKTSDHPVGARKYNPLGEALAKKEEDIVATTTPLKRPLQELGTQEDNRKRTTNKSNK